MSDKHLPSEVGTSYHTPAESPTTTPFVTPTSHSSGDKTINSIEQVANGLKSIDLGDSKAIPTSKAHEATVVREVTVTLSTPSSDSGDHDSGDSDSSSSVEIITDSPQPSKPEESKQYAIPRSLKAVAAKMAERAIFNYHMSLLTPGSFDGSTLSQNGRMEEIRTTPLFAASVMARAGDNSMCSGATNDTKAIFPQYGLLAQRLETYENNQVDLFGDHMYREAIVDVPDPRIFLNVNTPWSAFICGSQGSGKSHTLSCMLENSLLPSQLGALPKPLAAIVFHYDKFTSFASSQICEAAYLCSSGIPVRVLVSPSNFWRMQHAYSNMPGLPANARKPVVAPMLLKEKHLDVERMMNLMAVTEKDGPMPLYMEVNFRR